MGDPGTLPGLLLDRLQQTASSNATTSSSDQTSSLTPAASAGVTRSVL
jgi:hypothetical protein